MEPYSLALTTGLLGGFGHCIGMCGPLTASLSLSLAGKGRRDYIPHLLYNTGRITTYTFIGGLMGLTGSFVDTALRIQPLQNIVSIAAGLIMIFMGLGITGLAGKMNFLERHNKTLLRAARYVLESESMWRYYPLGMLMGFLPCGLSFTVFIASAGAGSMPSGMLIAFLFGIGTAPAMLLFGSAMTFVSAKMRGLVYRTGGVAVIMFGAYFIMKGSS